MRVIFLSVFLIFFGCTKFNQPSASHAGKSAQEVVKQFVELSASVGDQEGKRKLRKLCIGEMRRAFDRMTDEIFQLSYVSNKLSVEEFKVLKSKEEEGRTLIRYRVTVKNMGGNIPTEEIVEREVDLIESRGVWYLDSIRVVGSDKISFVRGMIF